MCHVMRIDLIAVVSFIAFLGAIHGSDLLSSKDVALPLLNCMQASLRHRKGQPHVVPPALITHYERAARRGKEVFLDEVYQMKLSGSLCMDRILGIL